MVHPSSYELLRCMHVKFAWVCAWVVGCSLSPGAKRKTYPLYSPLRVLVRYWAQGSVA